MARGTLRRVRRRAAEALSQPQQPLDVQVRAVLGQDQAGEGRFEDAARFLEQLFIGGLNVSEEPV